MDLKIETVEQLKEHLGGMYGINYDKLIQLEEGEEFSLDRIIDKIADLSVSEDYFKEPEQVRFNNVDQIIDYISKDPVEVAMIKGNRYKIKSNGVLRKIEYEPKLVKERDGKEMLEGHKIYKFVQKRDNKYMSYHDGTFEYNLGSEARPKGNDYLYFNEKTRLLNRLSTIILEQYSLKQKSPMMIFVQRKTKE